MFGTAEIRTRVLRPPASSDTKLHYGPVQLLACTSVLKPDIVLGLLRFELRFRAGLQFFPGFLPQQKSCPKARVLPG